MPIYKISSKSHYMTMLLGTWLVLGIFIDGYAHNHGAVETFFTPWHAVLYSGFTACAAWIIGLIYFIKKRYNLTWREAVPEGYMLGLLGIVIFLAGGLFDMVWHIVFGIEVDLEALLSPSHLALMLGGVLILTSPFRAGWQEAEEQPNWSSFLPYLLSLALSIGVVNFFLMYMWMFRYNLASPDVIEWYRSNSDYLFANRILEDLEVRGLSYILMNTLIFMYPVFLLLKRWKVPFGSFTFLFVFISVLMGVLDGFQQYHDIAISFITGICADLIVYWRRNNLNRQATSRLIAIIAPIVLWGAYFAWMTLSSGMGWASELWVGSIVQAALLSLGLSILAGSTERGR